MIGNGALLVVCRKLIQDSNVPVNKIEHLSEIFSDWSPNYINHRLYEHTPVTVDDAYYVYNTLVKLNYGKYAEFFLQEAFRDPFIKRESGSESEAVYESNLPIRLMDSGSDVGEAMKVASEALKDGNLNLHEIIDLIEPLQNCQEGINDLIKGLMETKLRLEIALRSDND